MVYVLPRLAIAVVVNITAQASGVQILSSGLQNTCYRLPKSVT